MPLTLVWKYITTVKIEVYLHCFTESVSLRELGRSTSGAEISSPNSLYLKAVKGSLLGFAFLGFWKRIDDAAVKNKKDYLKLIKVSCFFQTEK